MKKAITEAPVSKESLKDTLNVMLDRMSTEQLMKMYVHAKNIEKYSR